MKNLIKLIFAGMVIVLVLAGCNNDDEANETSDTQETEGSTEASETTGEAETDEAEGDESGSDETDSSSDAKEEILSLGETGKMETILGNFEVTLTAVQFLEKAEEDDPYTEPNIDVFVVVDVTLKNIDDEAIESSDIGSADLFDIGEDGAGVGDNPTFSSIKNFEGEIAPGEEMTGQFLFDHFEADAYQFAFGFGYTSDLSNEVRWEFTADEAE